MEQLDYDHNIHLTPGAGDESLNVHFYIDAVQDHAATKLAGRPIFRDAEHVAIRLQGARADGVTRVVRPDDIRRFHQLYAAFKARIDKDAEEVVGTPLSTWAWQGMTRARVEELKYFNCRTVEQLANMPDNAGQKLMHFQQMKQAAKQYLETVRLSAPLVRLQLQLEQAVATITEQSVTIAKLHAKVHGLPEPAAADVVVPMLEMVKAETPRPAEPPAPPPPPPEPEPVQAQGGEAEQDCPFADPDRKAGWLDGLAQGRALALAELAADMGKTRKRTAPPPPRRPGY